jgi:hypothetical protein
MKPTYEFNFTLQSFTLNLLDEMEADKVTGLLLSHNCFSDKFHYGISDFNKDSLTGILQIEETDFREIWRFVLILVKKYLGKDYLTR